MRCPIPHGMADGRYPLESGGPIGEDLPVDRILDLDQAASEITKRQNAWKTRGLTSGAITWRDESAPWPKPFETDRSKVSDPDSVGIRIAGPIHAELEIVLFRGGWADVDYYAGSDDFGPIPAFDLTSASMFAALLDTWVARVFGTPEGGNRAQTQNIAR